METLICKECGKVFSYKKMSSCKAQLKGHLKVEHNMDLLDYIVKHEYNGVRPVCPCGCGHELTLRNTGERWAFNTYYSDTCYGRMVKGENDKIRDKIKSKKKRDFDIVEYYESNYDRKTYEDAYNMLKTKQFSLGEVSKSYNIDKRTLKRVWYAMNIATPEELTELTDYTKYKLSSINNPNYCESKDSMLSWMYNMAKSHPGKYTIHSIIAEYNKDNKDNPCKEFDTTVGKALYKIYGDEIDIIFAVGYHSSEEYNYFNVLNFYFSKYKCRLGKKFILGDRYMYFDYLIGDRLLIEYDSVGKFHQSDDQITNDKEKENFAIENGYDFIRLNLDDTKDINTLFKIEEILINGISRDKKC